MPEALLLIKPTLTECKTLLFTELKEDLGPPFPLSVIAEILVLINCKCHSVLLKMCFMFLINSLSSETGKYKCPHILMLSKQWQVTSVCLSLAVFHSHSDIKPWCRWCWDWGQSGRLSLQQPLCLCCTWGSQTWPVRCCSHGQSIPCTALYPFFLGEKENKVAYKLSDSIPIM